MLTRLERTKQALAICQKFEGNDPFANITGNFDGAGLTAGALGWTIKWDNQDALVEAFVTRHGATRGQELMPTTWQEYLRLIVLSGDKGVAAAAKWTSSGSTVREPYRTELRNFWRSPEMTAIQVEFADKDMGAYAEKWGQKFCDYHGIPMNQKVFTWFFDLKVHNGGMSDAKIEDGDDGFSEDRFANWASGLGIPSNFKSTARDLSTNITIWSKRAMARWESCLLELSRERANYSRKEFRADTCNRKGTIAAGVGFVHGASYNLENQFTAFDGGAVSPPKETPKPVVNEQQPLADILRNVFGEGYAMELLEAQALTRPNGKPRYWGLVDFRLHSREKRLYIVDTKTGGYTEHLCAHGVGSEGDRDDGMAEVFSNKPGSLASSLGVYRVAEVYQGKHGLSCRMDGLSPSNTNVRSRSIVIHGADYVSEAFAKRHGRIGRSEGCFAVPMNEKDDIISKLRDGSLILAVK